jgi:hypothetical protein
MTNDLQSLVSLVRVCSSCYLWTKAVIGEDANGRYRSLVRVLPSLLMKRMGAHLNDQTRL